jgi:single-strand DNA-binding protein
MEDRAGRDPLSYEIDAEHIGHDLSRGSAAFKKHRTELVPSVIEDADADMRVAGELTTSLSGPDRVGGGYGEPGFYDLHGSDLPDSDVDAMAILRSAGLDPTAADPAVDPDDEDTDEEDLSHTPGGLGSAGGRGRKRGRQPVAV